MRRASARDRRPRSARHGGRGFLAAAILCGGEKRRHDRMPFRRVRRRAVRRISLVPPRGDPVRGHVPVVPIGRAAARPARTGRGAGRVGVRPRALSFHLPPRRKAALGQQKGRAHARNVRSQSGLVYGDPAGRQRCGRIRPAVSALQPREKEKGGVRPSFLYSRQGLTAVPP